MSFVKMLSRMLPRKMRDNYHQLLGCSTVKGDPDSFIGMAQVIGIVASFTITLFTGNYKTVPPLLVFVASFMVIEFLIYLWLVLNVSAKGQQVEAALPDALQLMSSNIRAGLTTDKALLLAARPEFGALEEELRRVGKETMAGRSLADALSRMTLHIRSNDLDRTIELLIHSLKSGGQLADLLDQTANDLRDQQIVQKEISASVLMYVLFIFIALAIGAPVLFSMSSFLVELLSTNMQLIAKEMPKDFGAHGGSMPIKMTGTTVSTTFLHTYAIISITLSCVFGGLIIGMILKGEEKEGVKYIPIMLFVALLLFFLATFVLKSTIGGMMPMGD
ncbi:MAG: type II secretion system F family protein [Candidatus Altiarchaeota archaeon]